MGHLAGTKRRRRDRHGRGIRGDLIPPHLPGYRSRKDAFDAAVSQAMGPLYAEYPRQLEHVEILVEDVPAARGLHARDILLGQFFPADRQAPPRIVLYRFPLENRCVSREELDSLVRRVIAENIALLIGKRPEDLDPDY